MAEGPSTQENLILDEGISFVGNPNKIINQYIEEAKFENKPIEFVVTTCPDYSYTYDACSGEKAQYTFEGVGETSGLVADGIAERMLPIIAGLEAAGIQNRLTFLYADTEAYDADICTAMGIEGGDFLCRIHKSAEDLFRKLHSAYVANGLTTYSAPSVDMMTKFMNPKLTHRVDSIFEKDVKPSSVNGIAIARRELYTRWFRNHPGFNTRNANIYNDFLTARAEKDVKDHLILGESLRQLSKGIEGHPSTKSNVVLVTMSDDMLARYFNFSGAHPHVPVMQVKKSY